MQRTLHIFLAVVILTAVVVLLACGEKIPLPNVSEEDLTDIGSVGDTTYIPINPPWDPAHGYNFNKPEDIQVDPYGNDPFIYVADTGNDRVVMLTPAGEALGSIAIPHPIALSQDVDFKLLVVNGTNRIFKIDLFAANHVISNAPVDTILNIVQLDHPQWRFTGIAAHSLRRYYVTNAGADPEDNQILSFSEEDAYQGPLPLVPNGTGLFAAASPSGIAGTDPEAVDFIFCQTGNNSFKVQWVTTRGEIGFVPRLVPATGDAKTQDIFKLGLFTAPEDVAIDRLQNIYVIDAGSDSLFRFNSGGESIPNVSFGGTGDGEKQFRHPMGVAWADRTVYVADTGNNRILRFKLSTDLQ